MVQGWRLDVWRGGDAVFVTAFSTLRKISVCQGRRGSFYQERGRRLDPDGRIQSKRCAKSFNFGTICQTVLKALNFGVF